MPKSKAGEERPSRRRGAQLNEKSGDEGGGYEVGYCKPPIRSRWGKGQSGNPYGRPRKGDKEPFATKVHPVRDMILEELERAVPIKEGGQMVEMETMRAILRSVNVGAIKGNRFQQKLALEYASAAQASRKADMEDLITNVEAYKQRWQEVFARARRNGDPEPRQIPHPDHVDVDPSTCQIVFKGPQTRDEKKAWDHLKFQIRESERKLRELRADAAARPRNSGLREICALAERHVHRLERMVPPGWDWREKLGWEADYTQKILTSLRAGGS